MFSLWRIRADEVNGGKRARVIGSRGDEVKREEKKGREGFSLSSRRA